MSDIYHNSDEIKRKVRKLKKIEVKIRFGNIYYDEEGYKEQLIKRSGLVWDEFFDLRDNSNGRSKYTVEKLTSLNKEEFKNVISEFFFNIYYRYYKENGVVNIGLYDPDILAQMGLPMHGDSNEIKKKFRELVKKYHPDTGGDSAKFIELFENYKKLNI